RGPIGGAKSLWNRLFALANWRIHERPSIVRISVRVRGPKHVTTRWTHLREVSQAVAIHYVLCVHGVGVAVGQEHDYSAIVSRDSAARVALRLPVVFAGRLTWQRPLAREAA